ncbi:unnamed protein product [Lupinus luteus]|uniref:Protein kinase domain-containing protein n=1 Tax=Lupinus luteus TaxID=3873 RepID=A0AAV1YGG3_LUPLU
MVLEGRGIGRITLDWSTRLSIIKDIAKGLDFLHNSMSSHKVPHANIKSSNVLIHQDNQGYHSKLTDYGFLPLLPSKLHAEKLAISEIEETTNDLSSWVRNVVSNDWSTDILDLEILAEKEGHDAMLKLTELALACTDMTPEKRPKMSAVLRRIEELEQMKFEND